MAEENQVMKEPQQVTTKNPNKVKVGKRLAEYNRRKREEKKAKREEAQNGEMNQYYGISAVIAVGVIGGLGYYIYQTKKGGQGATTGQSATAGWDSVSASTSGEQPSNPQQNNPKPRPQTNKFDMD